MSTWMVVEDEPGIYDLLLMMFEMWGIEGVAFVDGEEALAWIDDADQGRYFGETPELALIDIRLPGLVSGTDVGERLRQSPYLKNIGIVLTTAYKLSVPEEEAAYERTDADRLMYKPFPRHDEFKRVLEAVLEERRAKAEAEQEAQSNEPYESVEPAAGAGASDPEPPKPSEKAMEPIPSKQTPIDKLPPAAENPPSQPEDK